MAIPAPLRLAAAEDDPGCRRDLERILRTLPEVSLVESHRGSQPLLERARGAWRRGESPPWDVVLTDLRPPHIDGIALTRELKQLYPGLRVVVLTAFQDPGQVLAAICAGADGYLLKGSPPDDLVAQLRHVAAGGSPLSAALASTVLQLVRDCADAGPGRGAHLDHRLTPRQLEVFGCLARGLSYREIAVHLHISMDTVRSHIRQIYACLRVHNVAEAVGRALRHGLG